MERLKDDPDRQAFIEKLRETLSDGELPAVEGDGKATFLEPMTDEEYATWMHEQEAGWRKVYDWMLGRTNHDDTA